MRAPLLIRGSRKSGYRPASLSYRELFLQAADGLLGWADATGLINWLDMGQLMSSLTSPRSIATGGTGATTAVQAVAALGLGDTISGLARLNQNVLYTALLVAALRGVPDGLVDGVVDPFSTTADVNTSKSSGYTFTTSAGTIGATANNSAVRSGTAFSSGDLSGYPSTQAFDGSASNEWLSSSKGGGSPDANGSAYIGLDLGSGNAQAFVGIVLTNGADTAGSAATSVAVQASNDGNTFTNIQTFTGLSKTASAVSTLSFSNPTAYRYWRVQAVAGVTTNLNWMVGDISFTKVASYAAMTLQSATLASAVASPSAMRALIQVDSTSAALTPNTDMLVYLSRDGGTTFTQGTLALVQTMPDGTTIYDTGWLSVSAQPAGNSTMTYQITTPTKKAIVLTGVSMQVKP